MRREQCAGGDVERQQHQAGAEHGAENFIEFEGIHHGIGSL
jgi:hypothetical protein